LIEIIFQKKQDAWKLYQHLIARLASWQEMSAILLDEDRNRVIIPGDFFKDQLLNELKRSFYDFLILTKRDDWFRSILSDVYYYTEIEEQDQIIDIIYSVLEGERKDLAPFMEELDEEGQIKQAVNEIFNEKVTFSFDSFVKFRLKAYAERLSQWVETAIDEYKMEQEYQVFIHTLRNFLADRDPRMNHLYLVIDENMSFYNYHFSEIKRSELFRAIDRRLLVNHPVYVDSATIAPLLSIAPTRIYLYTDDQQQPLVRTIINIFEERVKVGPLSAFDMDKLNFLNEENENVR
jgi:putative sporulation protein YtxC